MSHGYRSCLWMLTECRQYWMVSWHDSTWEALLGSLQFFQNFLFIGCVWLCLCGQLYGDQRAVGGCLFPLSTNVRFTLVVCLGRRCFYLLCHLDNILIYEVSYFSLGPPKNRKDESFSVLTHHHGNWAWWSTPGLPALRSGGWSREGLGQAGLDNEIYSKNVK